MGALEALLPHTVSEVQLCFDLSEAAKRWKTLGSIAYVPRWVCMEIGVVQKDAQATV